MGRLGKGHFRVTRRYRKDFQLFASDLTLIDVMGGIFLRLMGGIHIYTQACILIDARHIFIFSDFPGIFRFSRDFQFFSRISRFSDFRGSAFDFAFGSLRVGGMRVFGNDPIPLYSPATGG